MGAAGLAARGARPVAEGTLLGIDEAGRGSVLGPLVVGGFLVRSEHLDRVAAAGACDSKLVGAEERGRIYRRLAHLGRRFSVVLSPSEVDSAVRRGELNLLEARAFGRIVREARPAEAYVDACDPVAERFGRTVAAFAGTRSRIVARHHADRDHVLVGAASIVAKVLRDRAVARLRRTLGAEFGSGYPSDPRTIAYLRSALRAPAEELPWVRHSWSTAARLKPPTTVATLDRFTP